MIKKFNTHPFVSAKEEVSDSQLVETKSAPTYQLAFLDQDFLLREELRPVRLQLELLKPELVQQEQGIEATIVIFGSARIVEKTAAEEVLHIAQTKLAADPKNAKLQREVKAAESLLKKASYYDAARELGRIVSEASKNDQGQDFFVITGGGPGIMEAANRGCHDAGAKSIGVGIVLPREEAPNPYVTKDLTFKFHYFAIRKMHFLMRARALIAFPGGFGTLDELFETLTLMQTRKIHRVPVLLYGREYWQKVVNFDAMVDEGVISPGDPDLVQYVDSPQEAWDKIVEFYQG